MRFVFVYATPGYLGGVETLLVRMSRWLAENGHEVTLLVQRGDHWIQNVPATVRCVVLEDRFRDLYYYYHARRLWNSLRIPRPDVIKSFHIGSSFIATQLASIVGQGCKAIAGLYSPFYFKWYFAPEVLRPCSAGRLHVENFLSAIPESARFVCGVDQIEDLAQAHGQKAVLWPIPIDTRIFAPATRRPEWGKIVSIGRLDVMKQYNLCMVEILQRLRQKGYRTTWTAFGTGDHEPAIRDRIQRAGLEEFVSLRGAVPYNQLWQVLEDAHVFVGMGTSVLEAALFKVPTVVALAYDRLGLTYGPIYTTPPGSLAPSLANPPVANIGDEIERILNLSLEDYLLEAERGYNHVQPHLIDASMQTFLAMVRNADDFRRRRWLYLANYCCSVFRKATRSKDEPVGHPAAPLFGSAGLASIRGLPSLSLKRGCPG